MKILTRSAKAMFDLVESWLVLNGDNAKRFPRPGQLMDCLPEETRELLRELRSDDIADVRPDRLGR